MRESLTRGLTQLGLSPDAVPQLEAYAAALLEKNRVMNLTAITAPQDVATLHLLDCWKFLVKGMGLWNWQSVLVVRLVSPTVY